MPRNIIKVSVTQLPAYRRLVDFLVAVDVLAADRVDLELRGLVEDCRTDLLAMVEEADDD